MIDHERLKESLDYNPETGAFVWKESRRGISKGKIAGSVDAHGYGQLRIDGNIYKEHRLAWFYMTGEWPSGQIDHINHQRRDNRFENLRVVDNRVNHRNRPLQNNNSTGYVGVHFHKASKKYFAYIWLATGRKNLGYFNSLEDAAAARRMADKQYGFHENHGARC